MRWRANGAGETGKEAAKGIYSDAFKRAGAMWGVGAYLYALRAQVVAIEHVNGDWRITVEGHKALRQVLGATPAAEPDTTPPPPPQILKEDSAAIMKVVSLALEFCETMESLEEWARTCGHRSDKWQLMHREHRLQMKERAAERYAAVRAADDDARRQMSQTVIGQQVTDQLALTYQPEPGASEPEEDAA